MSGFGVVLAATMAALAMMLQGCSFDPRAQSKVAPSKVTPSKVKPISKKGKDYNRYKCLDHSPLNLHDKGTKMPIHKGTIFPDGHVKCDEGYEFVGPEQMCKSDAFKVCVDLKDGKPNGDCIQRPGFVNKPKKGDPEPETEYFAADISNAKKYMLQSQANKKQVHNENRVIYFAALVKSPWCQVPKKDNKTMDDLVKAVEKFELNTLTEINTSSFAWQAGTGLGVAACIAAIAGVRIFFVSRRSSLQPLLIHDDEDSEGGECPE